MAMEEVVVLETPSSQQQHLNAEKKSNICEECGLNPSKYTCPCCSIRSCSLPCVKSHKKRTSCTGKRHRTCFVPLSQFDDNLIISDYNLLEEAKRVAESAKRRMRDGKFGRFQYKLPFKLQSLKNAAARRKTHIIFLPIGMSKREKNQTRYDHRLICS
ncbi:box C/D snoRNA protein [Thalictrum thalictroides]|uniref:Box C/D snoRNA protein 1 n=1 Tax=Thalictrum thalictroides TaxID=46969 RepID=A0A7J6XEK3_THATH|nr:box C/D snoRNA protein [Thalictrum thalictroides]